MNILFQIMFDVIRYPIFEERQSLSQQKKNREYFCNFLCRTNTFAFLVNVKSATNTHIHSFNVDD